MKREFTCIVCPNGLPLAHRSGKRRGDVCDGEPRPKGRDFAEKEGTAPTRSLCTTVKTLGGRRTGIAGAHSGRIAQGTPV